MHIQIVFNTIINKINTKLKNIDFFKKILKYYNISETYLKFLRNARFLTTFSYEYHKTGHIYHIVLLTL